MLSIEVLPDARPLFKDASKGYMPDPRQGIDYHCHHHHACAALPHTSSDAILAIAWSLRLWGGEAHCGIIIFDEKAAAKEACKGSHLHGSSCPAPHLRGRVVCGSEADVIRQLQLLVEEVDPDVVCGFDIQRGSIGYILDRCAHMR